jgi:hypothetical protein
MAFILRKLVGLWHFLLGRRLTTLRLSARSEQGELTPLAIEPRFESEPESVLAIPDADVDAATMSLERSTESAVPVRRSIKRELAPVWHFKSAILDRLDEFFICVRRVKKARRVS